VLQKPDVKARYARNYVTAHLDFGELTDKDPRLGMVERHNAKKWRPVLVFLDGSGKEVVRLNRGLKSAEDALLLDRFVSERHYLKEDFATFVAMNGD
jgi:hypothetical protein